MSPVPVLTYFDAAGRVFGLRACLFKAYGKEGWVDNRVAFKDWRQLKQTTPLGTLPTLTLADGSVMVQTESLARWAAKQAGLYPDDPLEALKVDEVAHTAFEVLNKCPGDSDLEVKKAKRLEYGAGFMKTAMEFLEGRMAEAERPFLLASGLSLADLQVFTLTDMILAGDFDHIDPGYMDAYPRLMESHRAVKTHSLVADYLANYPN